MLFDLSTENLYAQPGDFVTGPDTRGRELLRRSRDGKSLWLAGEGYGLLRDHLRDENVDAGLILRIVRRMAVAGHPLRAVRVALALLGSKAG